MSARTATELAVELRAQAARALEVADILDPPRKRRRRRRRVKSDTALEQVEQVGASLAAVREGARRAGVELERPTA